MKKIFPMMILGLLIFILASCASPKQPNINQIKESPEQKCGERTTFRFVTYIPLCDPHNIIGLVRDTNQWIQDNRAEYEFVDFAVINATEIRDAHGYHTMPSGVMIIHIPKEK